jgi:hypothetical protein
MSRPHLLAPTLAALLLAGAASAADKTSPEVEQAREAFVRGTELARDAQWGAALTSFERSARLRPHAWTTYDIAVCQRALGKYVLARRAFARALEQRTAEADLPEAIVADTRRFLAETDRIIAALDVTLDPADASIAVDGQPLEATAASEDGRPTLLAGTLPAGPGKPPPAASFRVLLDPGAHVFVITREGFTNAVHPEAVRPGERRAITLAVARMPATIAVAASEQAAVVTVDRLDVGVAPVTLERPAGVHHVLVRKPGFDPYEIDATLEPGQRLDLSASLKPRRPSLVTRWWFWTAAAVVVGGVAVTTWAATRPAPHRPPVDGGGLGWAVRVP